MHDDRAIVEERVARALRDRIIPALYREREPLRVEVWPVPGEPVPVGEAVKASYEPAEIGDAWGPPWSTTWFRLTGRIPDRWRIEGSGDSAPPPPVGRQHDRPPPPLPGHDRIEAVVDLGFHNERPGFQAEGLAYTLAGEPIKGIAPRATHVPLAGDTDRRVGLLVEAAANPDVAGQGYRPTPMGDKATAGDRPLYRFERADVAILDGDLWELAQDVIAADGLMRQLDGRDPRRHRLLRALERMADALDPDYVSLSAVAARAELTEVLVAPAAASAHRVFAVGHAHIDSAWLWPVRETIRKTARTFSNAMTLMDDTDNDDFVFACSQAQQLAWVKEHHPAVFRRIRERVASGQFAPVGGMWVESDTNMPGGEAMARQFLLGKRFLSDEFGVEPEEVWLPDSFGYSAAMPQIARLAGCRWFLTQKMSWSQTNRMPHHTFWWEGIDGSRIFTHFPPVDTYNSDLSAADLAHASATFAEAGVATMSLVPFGWGNGGGGPTREMIAAARRAADLEGSPRVTLASSRQFFEAAQAEYPDPPVWRGEMYLELHRGTFTSQANTKQGNRRSEHLLREAELWSAQATVAGLVDYPYDELDAIWKKVLLNQFHDILPGSSIAWVHREAEAVYAEVAERLEAIISQSQHALAGNGDTVLTFNAGPYRRAGVPAMAAAPQPSADADGLVQVARQGTEYVLDNGLLRVVVDRRGLITSVLDRHADRELIAPGEAGNLLQLHRDVPNRWDAWDVDEHYRRVVTDLTDVDEVGALANGVSVTRSFGASSLRQEITLRSGEHADRRIVDIVTDIDWHEREKILKAAFALDVHAEQFASEIQFGHLYRPTHTNTSWDAARFEVCAHRWIHVGEPGYGVAVANDSTYGHDVIRTTRPTGGTTTVVRLSLLRAPRYPDPEADQGAHRLRYSLVPGDVGTAVAAGYDLNVATRRVAGGRPVEPMVVVDDPAVVVEAVKLAEDRSGDIIVRLYEAHGGRASARVASSVELAGVKETDLLERPVDDNALRSWDLQGFSVTLRPFQITTVRLAVLK